MFNKSNNLDKIMLNKSHDSKRLKKRAEYGEL